MDFKKLQQEDPLKRMVEKQSDQEEFSPLNPPDAYAPPGLEPVPYENLPSFLQQLVDEHRRCLKELDALEEVLNQLKEKGLKPDAEINQGLKQFFQFLDENIVAHNMKKEKILFPLLQRRLLENGEHSQGEKPTTSVDLLEDDHIKLMQQAAVMFNFLGLAARLPDATSRILTTEAALEQGKALIELLRLHVFRKDNIVFAQEVKYLPPEEFEKMQK